MYGKGAITTPGPCVNARDTIIIARLRFLFSIMYDNNNNNNNNRKISMYSYILRITETVEEHHLRHYYLALYNNNHTEIEIIIIVNGYHIVRTYTAESAIHECTYLY